MDDFNFYTQREVVSVFSSPEELERVLSRTRAACRSVEERERNTVKTGSGEKIPAESHVKDKKWTLVLMHGGFLPLVDILELRTYAKLMCHKVVAGLFLAIWLTLFGIEFTEDAGFIKYPWPDMDRSIEATLAGFGKAIKTSDGVHPFTLAALSVPFEVVDIGLSPNLFFGSVSVNLTKETQFLERRHRLHGIHQVFLI